MPIKFYLAIHMQYIALQLIMFVKEGKGGKSQTSEKISLQILEVFNNNQIFLL